MKFNVRIDREKCKGCGLCVVFCPAKSLKLSKALNKMGVRHAVFGGGNCTGCRSCVLICPDACIEIDKDE
ncbi:MAG: 4Fe-4S dicluster domain-containing protein [Candidatus Omnitrophica bacterium]|nr:4Fe-4S dicluster domain-containing protein [Candidatus Omnitrophota bacterium]